MRDDLLIWWTDEADCREIGDPGGTDDEPEGHPLPEGAPPSIQGQYAGRYGRNGRGRLWVPDDIDLESIPWDDGRATERKIMRASAAGIVFRAADFPAVATLPGFVTDLALRIVSDGESENSREIQQ